MKIGRIGVVGCVVTTMLVSGCATGGSGGSGDGGMGTMIKAAGCAVGGVAGAYLAKALAESEGRRQRLPPAEIKKRERSYLIGLALIGCAGGAVLAGTAYAKLGEQGRKNRERELLEAARSSSVRTYRDPENPTLTGTVTPQPTFTSGNQECRTVEDFLADAGKGEPVLVKFCRTPPSGEWAQTAT
jgi:surface antigen